MNAYNTGLESLGYDQWFRETGAKCLQGGLSPARVVEVNRNSFRVSDGGHEMPAEPAGRFLFAAGESIDLPTVGDWVAIQALDNHSFAVIHAVLPRRTLLKRKEPGRRVGFQLIASNIDCGLVVQSAGSLNLNGMERYLVMLNESGIRLLVVANKTDLLSSSELTEVRDQLTKLNAGHVLVSTVTPGGMDPLSDRLEPRKSYCLLGPSGSGKTSILNRLLGGDLLRVAGVREKDGRGRHTTVRRQLVLLESGSIFIDTPGMRELGNFEIAAGIEHTFEDLLSHAAQCRFRDCTHVHEHGCAVIKAVEQGEIDGERYRNYLKLRKESEFYGMSGLEKRRKDRAFGKMVKNFKKIQQDLT
jgi:ribosome biogenesis GTPase